jgi:hypothetical protein
LDDPRTESQRDALAILDESQHSTQGSRSRSAGLYHSQHSAKLDPVNVR